MAPSTGWNTATAAKSCYWLLLALPHVSYMLITVSVNRPLGSSPIIKEVSTVLSTLVVLDFSKYMVTIFLKMFSKTFCSYLKYIQINLILIIDHHIILHFLSLKFHDFTVKMSEKYILFSLKWWKCNKRLLSPHVVGSPCDTHHHGNNDGDLHCTDDGSNEDVVQLLSTGHHIKDVEVLRLVTLIAFVARVTSVCDRKFAK